MKDLIDTHCHIHDSEYDFLTDQVLKAATSQKISAMICVGTNLRSSLEAIEFATIHKNCYASFGLHPHLAVQPLNELKDDFNRLKKLALKHKQSGRLVAIGECGLDYFYHKNLKIKERQKEIFKWQLELAQDLNLPLIFHIRQAFDDFYPIYNQFKLPAVLHSFSDTSDQVERGLEYENLYFGLNGIITFSKDSHQLKAAQIIPDQRLLLETDAPYLTPIPFRGKINKPEYLRLILSFVAKLRNQEVDFLADQTTDNARSLFGL